MNKFKLRELKERKQEIKELLALFERAAFLPHDGNNGGDPTAALNGIIETRIVLQTKGAALLQDENAAIFFKNLQNQLLEIENEVGQQYPNVLDLAIQWRGKPINTQERITSIEQTLGKAYKESAMLIRARGSHIYDSQIKAQTLLKDIQEQIENLIDSESLLSAAQTGILFLAAEPTNASRLRLGEEFRKIHEKLKLAKLSEQFKLELPQLSLRPGDITQALLDTNPQIVHFSGHGDSTGALCFENDIGQIQLVQPDALAALFEQFSNQVNCVLLNACYSKIQAEAISKHIKYVIGMNQAIGDKAAIVFAVGFYQALGAGRTIEDAYKLGCIQISLEGIAENLTPVLHKKNNA